MSSERHTRIRASQILSVLPVDLEATNAATDTYFPTYDLATQKFTWSSQSFVSNDGTVNPTNLLTNGNFEIWSAGASAAPDGWSLGSGGETAARESTIIKLGTYSAKLTAFGSDLGALYQYIQDVRGINYWKGRTVTFGCWVYASNASRVRLRIFDGITYTESSYHTGDSTWQWLAVTKTLSAVAIYLGVHFTIEAGTSISAYFDGAILVEGASVFAFSDRPVILGNNSENIPTTFVGKIGIGTTTVTSDLTFAANGKCISVNTSDGSDTGDLMIAGGGAAGATRGAWIQLDGNERGANPGDMFLQAGNVAGGAIRFGTGATTDVMLLNDAGNLGIGAESAGACLDIQRSAGSLRIKSTTGINRAYLKLENGTNTATYLTVENNVGNIATDSIAYATVLGNQVAYPLQFFTNTAVRMTILSDGKTGIGTNAPSALLDINSDILRLRTSKTPATAGAAGNAGDICWDSSYIYICVAASTWKRAAIATW